MAFKSHMKWSNACVNVPNNLILPHIIVTSHQLFWSCDTHPENLHVPKYCKTFDLRRNLNTNGSSRVLRIFLETLSHIWYIKYIHNKFRLNLSYYCCLSDIGKRRLDVYNTVKIYIEVSLNRRITCKKIGLSINVYLSREEKMKSWHHSSNV